MRMFLKTVQTEYYREVESEFDGRNGTGYETAREMVFEMLGTEDVRYFMSDLTRVCMRREDAEREDAPFVCLDVASPIRLYNVPDRELLTKVDRCMRYPFYTRLRPKQRTWKAAGFNLSGDWDKKFQNDTMAKIGETLGVVRAAGSADTVEFVLLPFLMGGDIRNPYDMRLNNISPPELLTTGRKVQPREVVKMYFKRMDGKEFKMDADLKNEWNEWRKLCGSSLKGWFDSLHTHPDPFKLQGAVEEGLWKLRGAGPEKDWRNGTDLFSRILQTNGVRTAWFVSFLSETLMELEDWDKVEEVLGQCGRLNLTEEMVDCYGTHLREGRFHGVGCALGNYLRCYLQDPFGFNTSFSYEDLSVAINIPVDEITKILSYER